MAASSFHPLLPIFFFFLSISHAHISNNAIVFPVTKHASSFHYITKIHLASEPVPLNVLIDLGAPFTWANCACRSSSRRLIPCRSIQCSTAKAHDCASGPGPTSNTCGSTVENPITAETTTGGLTEDVISAVPYHDSLSSIPVEFLYYCVTNSLFFKGLPRGVDGMLGFGGARTSAASLLAMALDLPRKFSVCLSPAGGQITIGESPSKPLTYTPLITSERDYFINVNGIKINGERMALKATSSGTKLGTNLPYTIMQSTIYDTFVKLFTKAAEAMNMTRVADVAPFGVCYDYKNSGTTKTPEVELVLQSEMVKWRINEGNLMVKMSKEVMCLGILDGGLNLKEDIVIGVHQLEDNLLEIDLSSSMLGYSSSSSLLGKHKSCSDIRSYPSHQMIS